MIEFLYVFPVSVLVSALAMTFGIGSAAFFSPFFLIVVGLPAPVAVGTALIIEIFGFSSGLFGFVRKKLVDYKVGLFVLSLTLPAAVGGVIYSRLIPTTYLQGILGIVLLVLAVLISHPGRDAPLIDSHEIYDEATHTTTHTTSEKGKVVTMSIVGGMLAGMVSSGSGEVNDYLFLNKYRMRGALAAGTSIFVLSWTILLSGLGHAYLLFTQDMHYLSSVMQIVLYAIPGVVIGAQIGVSCATKLSEKLRRRLLTSLLLALGLITIIHLAVGL